MKILATKNLSQAEIDLFVHNNLNIDVVNFTHQQSVPFVFKKEDLIKYDALIFTSKNAITHFFERIDFETEPSFLIFSINQKTQQQLQHKFTNIVSDKNALGLAKKIILHQPQPTSVLHICSKQKLNTLKKNLANTVIQYHFLEVYQTVFLPQKINTQNYDAIFFYSPSGVKSFFIENKIHANKKIVCLGQTTFNELKKHHSSNDVLIANQPSHLEMIKTLITNT